MKNLGQPGTPSCQEVNAIDIVSFLESIGYLPSRSSYPHFWYLSPLRTEKTASFKVNRKRNSWFDFGIQQGGSLVDFCLRYYNCTVKEVLQKFVGIDRLPAPVKPDASTQIPPEPVVQDMLIKPLITIPLLRYLMARRIDQSIAQQYCREAYYHVREKEYYAIAFENIAGGYELRNKYFKGGSSPKQYSFFDNKGSMLCVFEGFFDFLSFMTVSKGHPIPPANFLILNTVAFLDACQTIIQRHASVLLYLDNDPAGDAATQNALAWGNHIHDQRQIYQGHKDLNDWLCHIGNARDKGLFNHP